MLEQGRARARMPRTLILEPTRELAAQVEESFDKYGTNHKLNVALLIGGVSFDDQDAKLTRGVDVLIATPGRLLDHFERGRLLLTGVELLVIDEADRMLDMGFIPDIERICKLVPFTRQTLFFSATMPPEIQRITEPVPAQSGARRGRRGRPPRSPTITQHLVTTGREPHDKRDTLRRLIRTADNFKNAIIFCNRKTRSRAAAPLAAAARLQRRRAARRPGPAARTAALDSFRKGEVKLLIASDVAARGLDIPDVSHVFNYDVPHHADDYVHRIGRTGRAGKTGTAITIVAPSDSKSLARDREADRPDDRLDGRAAGAAESKRRDRERPRSRQPSAASRGGTEAWRERRLPRRPRSTAESPRSAAAKRRRRSKRGRAAAQAQQPAPRPGSRAERQRRGARPAEPRRAREPPSRTAIPLPAFLLRPVRVKA